MEACTFKSFNYYRMPHRCLVTVSEKHETHWHCDHEIIMVLQGKVTIRYGEYESAAEPGDVVFINRNTIHSVTGEPSGVICVIQFIPEILEKINPEYLTLKLHYDTTSGEQQASKSQTNALIAKIFLEERRREEGYAFFTTGYLNDLLGLLLRHADLDAGKNTAWKDDYARLHALIGYISENYSKRVTIESLAEKLGTSVSTLRRVLRKTMGVSFQQCLSFVRVDAAKKLILNSSESLAEIARQCGFGSLQSIHRIFKKVTGFSIKDYKSRADEISPVMGSEVASEIMRQLQGL